VGFPQESKLLERLDFPKESKLPARLGFPKESKLPGKPQSEVGRGLWPHAQGADIHLARGQQRAFAT
jgi:hypothetical protein